MADELFDLLGSVADGMGVAGAPVRAFRAWRRRDATRNLLGEVQREIDARWRDEATRADVYEQIARRLLVPGVLPLFTAAAEGDADAVEAIRADLAAHLGTESAAGSAEVADVVAETLANHVGRAQPSPEAAMDAVGRLRHEQSGRRLDTIDDRLERLEAGSEQVVQLFHEIREGREDSPASTNLARALVLGPLRRVGAVEDVRAAALAAEEGDEEGAAVTLMSVADRLDQARLGLAAESVRERAAALLIAAGHGADAVSVLLSVARARIARGTDLVRSTISALREALPTDEQWIADAHDAAAHWPGAGPEPVRALVSAVEKAKGREDELWFVARAVDLLSLVGEHERVLEIAAAFNDQELADGDRLMVQLDLLDAMAAAGDRSGSEQGWLALLRWADTDGSAESAGLAWQRRGVVLADREDVTGAHDAYRRAMESWSVLEGFEEQAGDAFFSMQAAAIVNAKPVPEPELRPLAYALRGGIVAPAARVDQLLSEGMTDRLDKGSKHKALVSFWRAFALARGTGSLSGTLIAASHLAELYQHAGEAAWAVAFWLEAGQGKQAADAAAALDPASVAQVLETGGSRRFRAGVYEVLARVGRSLTEEEAERFADQVLRDAGGEADAWVAPQPAMVAKRALSALALALPEPRRAEAFDRLVVGLDHPQIDIVRCSVDALVMSTNSEVFDATDRLFEVFATDPYNFGVTVGWVVERLGQDPAKAVTLRDAALAAKEPVLEALVLADLADADIVERCETAVRRWTEFQPTEESIADGRRHIKTGMGVAVHGAGVLGRVVSPALRRALVTHLLVLVSDERHPEDTRASAAGALNNISPALSEEEAHEAIDAILPLAQGDYGLSRWDANMDHPLSAFQISLHQPGSLRAAAITAATRLVVDHDGLTEALQLVVDSAIVSENSMIVTAAIEALGEVEALVLPIPLEAAIAHPEPSVRQAALIALLQRDGTVPQTNILDAVLHDPFAAIRGSLIAGLRNVPSEDAEPILTTLTADHDAYLRALAHQELTRLRAAS